MGKSLVIVESPAKAKTINKYLGSDYVVKSSVGHIRDLPTAGSASPVDPKERAKQAAKTRKMRNTQQPHASGVMEWRPLELERTAVSLACHSAVSRTRTASTAAGQTSGC